MTLHDFINKEQRINILKDVLIQEKVCENFKGEKQRVLYPTMWEMDDGDVKIRPGEYINLDVLNKFINKEADKFRKVFKDKILSYFPESSEEFMNLFCNAKDLSELYVMFSRVKISECSEDFQKSLSYTEEEKEKGEMEKDKYCMQIYLFRNIWDYVNGQIVPLPEKEEEEDYIGKSDIIILYTKSRLVLLKREKEERKQVLVILL